MILDRHKEDVWVGHGNLERLLPGVDEQCSNKVLGFVGGRQLGRVGVGSGMSVFKVYTCYP